MTDQPQAIYEFTITYLDATTRQPASLTLVGVSVDHAIEEATHEANLERVDVIKVERGEHLYDE